MIKRWRGLDNYEKKTRQVTMLFKPSVYEAIQKAAYVTKTSPNNLVGKIMEEYIASHKDLIVKYDEEES